MSKIRLKEIVLVEEYDSKHEEIESLNFIVNGVGGYGYVQWADNNQWYGSFMGCAVSGSRCKVLEEAKAHAAFLVRSLAHSE